MVWLPISAGDVAVTVAPGSTAPWVSVTSPVTRPWVICAIAGDAVDSAAIARTTINAALDLICSSTTNRDNKTLAEPADFNTVHKLDGGMTGDPNSRRATVK